MFTSQFYGADIKIYSIIQSYSWVIPDQGGTRDMIGSDEFDALVVERADPKCFIRTTSCSFIFP